MPDARPAHVEHTNRLIHEKSPYLLQHAHNPVDWYPWGEEAFAKARRENKPIFLSIGYSTCHWCHVMAHESFENEEVAAIMNARLRQHQSRSRRAAGCRSRLHDLRAGDDRRRRLADERLAHAGSEAVCRRHLFSAGGSLRAAGLSASAANASPTPGKRITTKISESGSADHGRAASARSRAAGGGAARSTRSCSTPPTSKSRAATIARRRIRRRAEVSAAGHAQFSLPRLRARRPNSRSGQGARSEWRSSRCARWRRAECTIISAAAFIVTRSMRSGTCRISRKCSTTRRNWRRAYLDAFQITGDLRYEAIARDTLDYVRRDLTARRVVLFRRGRGQPNVAGASRKAKKRRAPSTSGRRRRSTRRSATDAEIFNYHYGVEADGNAPEGSDPQGEFAARTSSIERQTLRRRRSISERAKPKSTSRWRYRRATLLELRAKRPRPHLDDKIITAWNGLMISAFARGAQVLGDPRLSRGGDAGGGFVRTNLYDAKAHTLLRSYRGGRGEVGGFADDYAFYIQGLLDLYEASFDVQWLELAEQLQATQDRLFWDEKDGGYFRARARTRASCSG